MQKKTRHYCPFCKSQEKKFCIFHETESYHCYRCGETGKMRDIEGLEFKFLKNPRVNKFESHYGTSMDRKGIEIDPISSLTLLKPESIGWNYLVDRKIDPEPLIPYSVGTSKNYLYFPFYRKKKLVYYVGRKLYGSGPKYKAAEVSFAEYIFIPYGMEKENTVLLLVEGMFDSLAVYQNLSFPAVGLMGKDLSPGKLLEILRHTHKDGTIYIMLDPEANDPSTVAKSIYLYDKLKVHREVGIITLTGELDPAELML